MYTSLIASDRPSAVARQLAGLPIISSWLTLNTETLVVNLLTLAGLRMVKHGLKLRCGSGNPRDITDVEGWQIFHTGIHYGQQSFKADTSKHPLFSLKSSSDSPQYQLL